MKVAPPPLAPILRSSAQGRILASILVDPLRERTLSEIAAISGASQPTVHREIDRAQTAGIVTSRRVGHARVVRANARGPHLAAVREIVLSAFGPPAVVAEAFGSVAGIDALVLFGSWAARYLGVDGPAPNDLDVLVIGRPDRHTLYEAAERAERTIGFPVHPVVRSVEEWGSDDAFLTDLRSKPLVVLSADDAMPALADLVDRVERPL